MWRRQWRRSRLSAVEGGVACIFKKKKRGKKEKSEEKTEVVAGEDGGNGGATRHRLRLKKDSICQ